MTAVSIRLPDDVSQRLRQLAARTGRSRTWAEEVLDRAAR